MAVPLRIRIINIVSTGSLQVYWREWGSQQTEILVNLSKVFPHEGKAGIKNIANVSLVEASLGALKEQQVGPQRSGVETSNYSDSTVLCPDD